MAHKKIGKRPTAQPPLCAITASRFSVLIGLGRISGVGEKTVGIERGDGPV